MLVVTLCLDVEIGFGTICKRFKEVEKHLSWHFPNHFTLKLCIPHQPCASSKINGNLRKAIVHRQTKTIALNSKFVSQCHIKSFTQSDGSIFNGVVLIDFQISFGGQFNINPPMTRQLIQHMIKKGNASIDCTLPSTIEIERNGDVCFFGCTFVCVLTFTCF